MATANAKTKLNYAELVDDLLFVREEIKKYQKREDQLRTLLLEGGKRIYEGTTCNAVLVEQVRKTLDLDAVRAKLSPQFILAHTRETEFVKIELAPRSIM